MAEHLRLMVYDKDRYDERDDIPLAEAIKIASGAGIGWITLYAPTPDDYQLLESDLGLHPLALEDTQNERQRPKVEDFPDSTFIVARSLHRDADGSLRSSQSNIFFAGTWILVIHERPLGLFDGVRDRIRRGRPRIRSSGVDYLGYALLDAVVDTYFPILETMSDRLEVIEEGLSIDSFDPDQAMADIHAMRHELRRMRRHIWPAREAFGSVLRDEVPGIKKQTVPFYRDVHDHVIQAIDLIETHREAVSSLMDLHLTMLSNRTNDIMRVLTIVATIFIPITFIAGVYGMNFDTTASAWNMPELGWPYAYVAFWVVTLALTATMLLYFRRRGWL